ncbi:putative SLACS retrotransposable element [Trypanosoma cruzi]|uniref:Putative SLACS retrotransposable element n=1 Tax=Trypanosoma cruzi TaxID=5693 RepID=A0A2V2UQN5_TRYCR|nr:putative SLACS retrotransposable element [Trypanosoma cruzi]
MIDGMVQRVQRKPINTHKVILCLYRRLMPEMGPEEDEEDDEQESHARHREQDGRTLASAPKGSRLPNHKNGKRPQTTPVWWTGLVRMDMGNRQAVPLIPVRQPRRHLPPRRSHRILPTAYRPTKARQAGGGAGGGIRGRRQHRRGDCLRRGRGGTLTTVSSPTSSPTQPAGTTRHFLDEEEEEITLRRTQPQATPSIIRMRRPTPTIISAPGRSGDGGGGVGGDEGESETPRHTTGQEDGGHPFSHDKTPALLDPVWCLAGGCHHSFSGPRRGEHLRSHIHAVHRKQERMDITNEALISQGLVRCDACGEVCSASLRARAAHRPRCGHYTCRKENIATQREEYRASVTGSHYTKTAACLERTPPVEWPTTPATDPRQDPWLQERVPTRRYLHKREWPNWLDVCRTVMLGYNASAPDERSRKQVAIMDLVRHHLRLPEKPSSRRHATAPTTTSSITPTSHRPFQQHDRRRRAER